MDPLRFVRRWLRIARDQANSGFDAALTIGARVASLASPVGADDAKTSEASLMVQEKVDATIEGCFAALEAWNLFVIKAAFGALASPQEMSFGLVDVAHAATAPARRRVAANARRLTGSGRTA